MASGLASLAGYGSDSDDDEVVAPIASSSSSYAVANTTPDTASKPSSSKLSSFLPPPRSGLASKLPPPSSTASASSSTKSSRLSLPPPVSSVTKRKVIKVDSLQSARGSDDAAESEEAEGSRTESKKPKLGFSSASSSKHSLFGMLPAPKRKDDEILAERKKEADARKAAKAMEDSDTPTMTEAPLRINEDLQYDLAPEDMESAPTASSKPKGKSNDAFRAMLGLKPATKKPPVPTASTPSSSTPVPLPQAVSNQLPAEPPKVSHGITESAPAVSKKADAGPSVDFFSLGTGRDCRSTASATHTPTFSISSAPVISDTATEPSSHADGSYEDAVEYPGWQLDPDGSWVPVTPEAKAQLLVYQESLQPSHDASSSSQPARRNASNLDGTRDLLAAGLTPEDIRAFDASTAAREAYQNAGDDADSDKYAAAAEFAAGNRDVQQRKPGVLKGLRKGQLSSLVSLANENRSQLEQKWQRGREAHARRANQYGW